MHAKGLWGVCLKSRVVETETEFSSVGLILGEGKAAHAPQDFANRSDKRRGLLEIRSLTFALNSRRVTMDDACQAPNRRNTGRYWTGVVVQILPDDMRPIFEILNSCRLCTLGYSRSSDMQLENQSLGSRSKTDDRDRRGDKEETSRGKIQLLERKGSQFSSPTRLANRQFALDPKLLQKNQLVLHQAGAKRKLAVPRFHHPGPGQPNPA